MKKIVVTEDVFDEKDRAEIREAAEALGYQVVFSDGKPVDDLSEAEIIYGGFGGLFQDIPLNNLKWIHSSTAGVEPFLKDGVLPEGCLLSNSSGAYGVAVAEHGFTLMMMLLRHMPEYMERVKARVWSHDLSSRSLYGSRITVLGTGDIGRNFAQRAKAFQPASITGVNRSGSLRQDQRSGPPLFDRVIRVSELDTVLPETDILFMALPGTKETEKLMDAEKLSLLPQSAILVNVGRGSTIDQPALCSALNNGVIAAAGLDVFEKEPIPEGDPAWEAKNLLITTHCAGWMLLDYTRKRNIQIFLENLVRYDKGEKLVHEVNRAAGY